MSISDIFQRLHDPGPLNLYCVNQNCPSGKAKEFITRRLSDVLRNEYYCNICGGLLSENRSWIVLIEYYCWSNFCIQWFLIGWARIVGRE